jgi:hypothetical protein
MAGNVETLCSGCANLALNNGGCKLSWVSRQNQIERVEAGYCEDAQVLDDDAMAQDAAVVLVPNTWFRIFNKK